MEELDELYTRLRERPIVLNVKSNGFGPAVVATATGTLFISPDNENIQFNFFLNKDNSLAATSFTGTSPYGSFRIVLGGEHSSSTWQDDKHNEQRQCPYNYILFSDQEDVVSLGAFTKASFHYYPFIKHIDVDEDDFTINLFDKFKHYKQVASDFRIGLTLTSHRERRASPFGTETKFDRIRATLTFSKPKRVNEIRALQHKLDNYLTLFLGVPIFPQEVILYTEPRKDPPLPRYCYLLPYNAISKAPSPIDEDEALSFSRYGKDFLQLITRAIDNQDSFDVPINLMHVYWEYRERKVYLDSQWSVLLACLESVFELIHTPSPNQQKREKDYTDFIQHLGDITVDPKLKKWLEDASTAYSDRMPYAEKAKAVVAFIGGTLPNDKAETLNQLRNDLMHGRLPQWNKYMSNEFEIRTGTEGAKVRQNWIASVVTEAILKVIKESK